MRKLTLLLLFFTLISLYLFAGTTDTTRGAEGINFESGLTWQKILDKAKRENRYIFVDCFATWCAPCKFMSENIFTKKEAGDYMNSRFICVAVQMDRTSKDNEYAKSWYDRADSMAKEFSISEYPTYLFFSPSGQPVHRIAGSTGSEVSDFIKAAANAFDTSKQYYTILSEYQRHLNDSSFLRKALKKAVSSGDKENAEAIADAYVLSVNMDFNKINIGLICDATRSSKDKGFTLLLDNAELIDSMYGRPKGVEHLIYAILQKEEIVPFFAVNDSVIAWSEFRQKIKKKYPRLNETTLSYLNFGFGSQIEAKEFTSLYEDDVKFAGWAVISDRIRRLYPGFDADKMIANEKMSYYAHKGLWVECGKAGIEYLDKYSDQASAFDINNILWNYLFIHCDDRNLIKRAVELGRRMVDSAVIVRGKEEKGTYELFDTYANLLYKAGNREAAMEWEKRALEDAGKYGSPSKQTSFRITMERMEKGESTIEGRNKREEYQ